MQGAVVHLGSRSVLLSLPMVVLDHIPQYFQTNGISAESSRTQRTGTRLLCQENIFEAVLLTMPD